MASTTVRMAAPADFNLCSTVRSHGWSDLPPFDTDRTGDTLVIHLGPARATVTQEGRDLKATLESPKRLTAAERRAAAASIRSCLRLDLDLTGFWALCRSDPELCWADRRKAGRLLRAPTAWADAMMILATTNCSWALTRRILAALSERWGEGGALPARNRLARVTADALRRHGRLGYRAPYLAALARGPDLEALRTDPAPTDQLYRRLLALPGFGPYAAGNLLRLLGRFEHLALDSWVIKAWRERYPRRKATETAIAQRLKRYGEYKGLAFWLLVTERWYGREDWRV
ncbi:MAG: DNA-3-methyladenine glycosylase family protein [Planctomycetota bacterium]